MVTGLIGGTGYASTVYYYEKLNRAIARHHNDVSHQDLLLYSLDFTRFTALAAQQRWDRIKQWLTDSAKRLETAGADRLALLAVTLHFAENAIVDATDLPVISITDSIAKGAKARRMKKILLLGTLYTMEFDFIKKRLDEQGLVVEIPAKSERLLLHRYIYDSLAHGKIRSKGQQMLQRIADKYARDVDGIILGCTELPEAFQSLEVKKPVVSSTDLHINDILSQAGITDASISD